MSDNLSIYTKVRAVPNDAQKTINGGRLSGYTDINPMWRIKVLTEIFGCCGIGWKYIVEKLWLEPGPNSEVAAFAEINLFIKYEGKWSDGIPGVGGSSFVAKEKNGLYMSDECYKMAVTDAISVACKALGVGADIYWGQDKSKYSAEENAPAPKKADSPDLSVCDSCNNPIKPVRNKEGKITTVEELLEHGKAYDAKLCYKCLKKAVIAPKGDICESCGNPIKPVRTKDGKTYTVDQLLEHGKEYDAKLCYKCLKKAVKDAGNG